MYSLIPHYSRWLIRRHREPQYVGSYIKLYLHSYWSQSFPQNNKGAFTLTLSEYPCPSQCPSPWQNCVYTTSEARIRGHPRPWPFLVACSSDHVNRRLWACALHNLGRPRKSVSVEIATWRARTRTSETKVSDTDSDQRKHETSIHYFWLRPSSDSDARTEISDVV